MDFKPLPLEESKFKSLPLDSDQQDGGGFKPLPIKSPIEPPEQETPYMAKHPNLYAAEETAKDLAKDIIPYVKYFDPKEREDFMKLDKQHQVRALLKENLFSQLFLVPGSKGFKYGMGKASGWFAKNFPKTSKLLTKPRMVSKLQQEELALEATKQTPEVQKVMAALKEAKPLRKEQELIYTKERTARLARIKKVAKETTGEERYYAKLHELKGEMPKVQFESIRESKIPPLSERTLPAIRTPNGVVVGEVHGDAYNGAIEKFGKNQVDKWMKEGKIESGHKFSNGKFYTDSEVKNAFGTHETDALIDKLSEPIRPILNQQEVNTLFNTIESSTLNEWEKLPTARGLAKLLGEFGGHVPTENELAKLSEVFGNEFVKIALDKRTLFIKYKELGLQVANIPRAIMASFDFSAPLRQGVFLIGKPKAFFSSFFRSFKPFFSERSYQELTKEIFSRSTAELMQESGLSLTHLGKGLIGREEVFMSNLAERIPLVGRGVRASERSYVSFLNKLRADVFDDFVKKGVKLGIKDPRFLKDAARFINTATGRGGLGPLEPAAVQLNTWFFSPRLIASRLNLVNPAFYIGLEPTVRKEALKSLFTFGSTALGVAGLATYGGADIVVDPRSADFLKIKFGNTRYDILGGFQQPIRLAAQLISGKVISSTTGKTMTLGEGYRGLTRTEIISRYLEYKQAPVVSFAVGLLRGKTSLGEKFDLPTEVANRFIPMVVQDINELYKEKGLAGLPMAAPGIFGIGVQSYGGVQSFGLNGKDYPKLNNELLRLKTSMGYPSTVAFGEELTNKEYKNLKQKTGKDVADFLNKLIITPAYKERSDFQKLRLIESRIDLIKDRTKKKMFPQKMKKSMYKSHLIKARGLDDEEADKQAEEYLKRNN